MAKSRKPMLVSAKSLMSSLDDIQCARDKINEDYHKELQRVAAERDEPLGVIRILAKHLKET